MSEFPLDPQLAKMLVASPEFRCLPTERRCSVGLLFQPGLHDASASCCHRPAAKSWQSLLCSDRRAKNRMSLQMCSLLSGPYVCCCFVSCVHHLT
mmetsp:Transcript_20514/g.57193  ORF Transcript_20514/g.57193 Transcript_20514/m.57193 type:complete len:95 (+) Transcript_20514:3469-3753(+)